MGVFLYVYPFMQVPKEARTGLWKWNSAQLYGPPWEMLATKLELSARTASVSNF